MEQVEIKKDFQKEAAKFGLNGLDDALVVLRKTQELLLHHQETEAYELSNLYQQYEQQKAA